MSNGRVFRNIGANFLGKLANRLVRILLVPLQISILGEEAFGLLGFYALITGLMAVLDLGLSATANREVARLATKGATSKAEIRDLIRTFELPYWLIGVVAGIGVMCSAGWIRDHWINVPTLPAETVVFALAVIGLLFVVRWPLSLYVGILFGLQRQVEANILVIMIELLNAIGSVCVLVFYPDIKAFFVWQMILGIIEVTGYLWLSRRYTHERGLPSGRFRLTILRRVWRYAVGVNLVSLTASIFAQADSLILSKILPITQLGYYALAQRTPTMVGLVSGPILGATNPIVVGYYEQQQSVELSRIYYRQARWLAFLSMGIALPMAAFAHPILLLWTQSATLADATWLSFALIAVAAGLEVSSNVANQFTLVCGFTRPPLIISSSMGLVLTVGTLMLTPSLGITGAAIAFFAARVLRYLLFPFFVKQLVLPSEPWWGFFQATMPLLILGSITLGGSAWLYAMLPTTDQAMLWMPIAFIATLLYAVLSIWLNLIPDWHQLPFLARIRSLNSSA